MYIKTLLAWEAYYIYALWIINEAKKEKEKKRKKTQNLRSTG